MSGLFVAYHYQRPRVINPGDLYRMGFGNAIVENVAPPRDKADLDALVAALKRADPELADGNFVILNWIVLP